MAWNSLLLPALFLLLSGARAAELPRFYTKHATDTLRFITMDGRYAYVQKRPGVLSLVSSFRSVDFLSEANGNDYIVRGSRFRTRLAIESVPNPHDEMNLLKNHPIYVVDFGNTGTRAVGAGRNAKLHLNDEWLSYYDAVTRVIHIQNLVTQKKYEIRTARKANPFFVPEVEMVSTRAVVYTEINEAGFAALVSFDLEAQRSTVAYKSAQTATRLELCLTTEYLGLGEFPYDGVSRGSKLLLVNLGDGLNLAGFTTLYSAIEQDLGNIVCRPDHIYFIKTMNQDPALNYKVTEAVRLDVKTKTLEARSSLKFATQLLEMDGRVMIPFRGDYFVLEGIANIGEDTLRPPAPPKEELQLDL
jgi:hypothetical protein